MGQLPTGPQYLAWFFRADGHHTRWQMNRGDANHIDSMVSGADGGRMLGDQVCVFTEKAATTPNLTATEKISAATGVQLEDLTGDVLLVGVDPASGEYTDLPASVAERLRS